ncbi:MAG: hypothetical protein KDE24_23660, partial [Caldilinea sp.]|nr:hypothetical protein [Caldilinea sp.]
MREITQLEWEILEAEEEEWVEVTMAPPADEPRPAHRQWLAKLLGSVALLATLSGMIGYRLVQDAEAGIAATERHIGTLVQVETIRQPPSGAAQAVSSAVDTVLVKGNGAMVRVVVTETSSLGRVLPHIETRFYERCPAGWRRTEPIPAFWGEPAVLETPTLHFEFYELDRPYVEAVAEPIDTYHVALRQILGLAALAVTGRVTVAVTTNYVAPGTVPPDGTLVEPSPYLYFAAPPGREGPLLYAEAETTLLHRLQAQLRTRTIQESRDVYGIQVMWQPLAGHLEFWLREHAAELPALARGGSLQEDRFVWPAQALVTLTGEHMNSTQLAEDLAHRSDVIAFSAHAFFDFLAADRGPDAIPALLAAFG